MILAINIYAWTNSWYWVLAIYNMYITCNRNMGFNDKMKYFLLIFLLISCSRDFSIDPTTTISKEIIKFLYDESKPKPVMEWD